MSAEDKEKIDKTSADLKKALESKDTADIKTKMEALQKIVYDVSAKIYKDTGGAPPPPGAEGPKQEGKRAGEGPEGKTVDAEFETKDDDKK